MLFLHMNCSAEDTLLFAECEIQSRAKDAGSSTAEWYAEMLSKEPWFKDVVPGVSPPLWR